MASTKALDLFHWEMRAVLYRCTAVAIKMAIKVGPFFHRRFVCCCPGGHWCDTEQVVAQCWCPVASKVALDMSHRAMPSVSLRRTAMAIKQPADKVHLFVIVDFVINNNRSQRPCYGPLKLNLRHSNIYYNVISLLLCFGHLPTTIDALLATIVAGGQALIQLYIRMIKIY